MGGGGSGSDFEGRELRATRSSRLAVFQGVTVYYWAVRGKRVWQFFSHGHSCPCPHTASLETDLGSWTLWDGLMRYFWSRQACCVQINTTRRDSLPSDSGTQLLEVRLPRSLLLDVRLEVTAEVKPYSSLREYVCLFLMWAIMLACFFYKSFCLSLSEERGCEWWWNGDFPQDFHE